METNVPEQESDYDLLVARCKHWQRNPLDWVVDMFGDNIRKEVEFLTGQTVTTVTGLTRQQEEAMVVLGELIGAKLDRHFRRELTPRQVKFARKIGISIMAAQGVGKDFWAALVALFMMTVFPDLKGLATANTAKQLRNVYWAEISKIMRLSRKIDETDPQSITILQDLIVWQSEKIYWKSSGGKEWFIEAVVTAATQSPEEQATALAGRHEKFMAIVVDEAAGVPDGVMNPLEGTLTGIVNLVFLIFNPTRTKGYAINSQREDSRYVALHWSAEDSEIVPKEKILADEKAHGRSSNYFRIRCLGLPPVSDESNLIPWAWVERATEAYEQKLFPINPQDPILAGMDPAAGGDKAIGVVRTGPNISIEVESNTKDTMVLSSEYAVMMDENECDEGLIDNIGLGLGVFNRLQQLGYKVRAVDARKGTDKEDKNGKKFKRLRDEMYWRMRTAFEEGRVAIPPDLELMSQLTDIKWNPNDGDTITVESKKSMKQRGLPSPDKADACAHTYAFEDRIYHRRKSKDGHKLDFSGVYLR
jgi:hypothetical protein